jgi:predicted negative regulator of RcsB-dependent stress response
MAEPRLEDISDYDSLKGDKKKIVYRVLIVGLVLGALYSLAYNYYDNSEDNLSVEKSIKSIPVK